jgi:hypothetical protein
MSGARSDRVCRGLIRSEDTVISEQGTQRQAGKTHANIRQERPA